MTTAGTVDWDRLVRRVGSDPAFLSELLTIFQEEKEKHVPSLRKALDDQDRDLLVKTAHALKGLVGNLCAPRVFEEASRLEECSRRGAFSDARDLWTRLEKGLEDLTLDFQKRLKNIS